MERRSFLKRSLATIATLSAAAVLPVNPLAADSAKNKKGNKKIRKKPLAKRVLMLGLDGICVEGLRRLILPILINCCQKGFFQLIPA